MSEVPQPPLGHLPRLKEWQSFNDQSFGLSDLLAVEGNLDIITACAQLFWPKFIEIDGCVLREEAYSPENFQNWMTSTNGNRTSIESVMNHIHIYDLLPNPGGQEYKGPEYELEAFEYIGEILRRTWKAALAEQFPGKTFVFQYVPNPTTMAPQSISGKTVQMSKELLNDQPLPVRIPVVPATLARRRIHRHQKQDAAQAHAAVPAKPDFHSG